MKVVHLLPLDGGEYYRKTTPSPDDQILMGHSCGEVKTVHFTYDTSTPAMQPVSFTENQFCWDLIIPLIKLIGLAASLGQLPAFSMNLR